MTTRIAILDYGMGNLRSVEKALEHVGVSATIGYDADLVREADGLVLPGVGAFPKAMERVRELRLDVLGLSARELKRLRVLTVVDTDGEPMRRAVRAEPDVISPNVLESEELVGHEFNDDEDRMIAVREMCGLGAREAHRVEGHGVESPHEESVGGILARARAARGFTLEDVAQQLKFGSRQLEALEQDRFDRLPSGTFARGMVRSYARLLKLDADALLGAGAHGVVGLQADEILDLQHDPLRVRAGQVDLVDHRDDSQVMFHGHVKVGNRLGLHTL